MSFGAFLDGMMDGMERGSQLKEYRARAKHNDRLRKYQSRMLDEDEATRDAGAQEHARQKKQTAFEAPIHAAARASAQHSPFGENVDVPMPTLPKAPARTKPFQVLAGSGAKPPKKRVWPLKGSAE